MEKLLLPRLRSVAGDLLLPGSKSLSNRALLVAALGRGPIELSNCLESDDVDRMAEALQKLGVPLKRDLAARSVTLTGCGGPLPSGNFDLYLGNAGTAVRSVTAALCAGHGQYRIDGNARMRERPIKALVNALKLWGVKIGYEISSDCPPLLIDAQGLPGGRTEVDGSLSSQYITALLLAAPLCRSTAVIEVTGELVSRPYVEMTVDLMRRFGVSVDVASDWRRFVIPAGQSYVNPPHFAIEGDASSASYFLGAAAISGKVRVRGCGSDSVQGEAGFAHVMGQMGAAVEYGPDWIEVTSSPNGLIGVDVDMDTMTDTGMTLAVVACFARGRTVIRNIGNWQVKETKRITAVATELRKVGAMVEEGSDYLVIDPPAKIQNAEIFTYDDHRMAMAFSLLSLGSDGITILDPGCTRKTFPDYFDVFGGLGKK